MDIFGNDDGEKKDDKMLVKCIKEPDSKCEDVHKILLKNTEIERVGRIMLKQNLQDKNLILKMLMKSYFRKKLRKDLEEVNVYKSRLFMKFLFNII